MRISTNVPFYERGPINSSKQVLLPIASRDLRRRNLPSTIDAFLQANMSTTTTTVVEAPQTTSLSAEMILRLFPDIDTTSTSELDGHDAEQIRLMDEVCIVLDDNDQAIGTASKKICTRFPREIACQSPLADRLTTPRRPSHEQHRQRPPPQSLLRLSLQR